VELVFNAAVAGSGIRTIQTDATEPAGNVDLIAPEGSVNAGDAGIGAAGNINIAAVTVTGVSNINFGGSATACRRCQQHQRLAFRCLERGQQRGDERDLVT